MIKTTTLVAILVAAVSGASVNETDGPLWQNASALIDPAVQLAYLDSLLVLNLSASNYLEPIKYWPPPQVSNPHAKAVAMVKNMTVEEKVQLTTGMPYGRCAGQTSPIPSQDFNGLCLQDGPAGVRGADLVTGFPPELTLGATWDRDLVKRHYYALADEFRGKGVNIFLGPVTGGPMGRSAYDGRLFENFAADPFLTGELSYVSVKAVQERGVQACSKHFIGYEQETFRNPFQFDTFAYTERYSVFPPHTQFPIDSMIPDRSLHEIYTWAFADAIRAGTASVMCSYNRVNGTHACEDSYTLNHVLKEELGFQGYVVSDWGGVYSTENAIKSGLDMTMPGGEVNIVYGEMWGQTLVEMVKNGTVPESRLDDAALRILTPYFALGQDSGYPAPNYNTSTTLTWVNGTLANEHVNVQADHASIVQEVGEGAIVLLKNEKNALPLGNVSSLALFGSDAGPGQFGPNCPGAFSFCPPDAYNNGTMTVGAGSGTSKNPYVITPLAAITERVQQWNGSVNFLLDDYCYAHNTTTAYNDTINSASTAIVFVNLAASEGWDRDDLNLDRDGDELILQVASQINNTIVVMHVPNPPMMAKWIDHPNVTAVVHAFLPGQETGNSLTSVLFGDVSPSGKLPYTIAKNETDYIKPVSDAIIEPRVYFDEDLLLDYRRFDALGIEPQFEFGFGLSYTTFNYSGLNVTPGNSTTNAPSGFSNATASANSTESAALYDTLYTVSFTIQNTGGYTGSEISQVYVSYPESAGEPPKVLRGFDKAKNLKAGDKTTVTIPLSRKAFSIWDTPSQSWVTPKGDFTIGVGASSRDIRLNATVTL